jgi:hypothetical protein
MELAARAEYFCISIAQVSFWLSKPTQAGKESQAGHNTFKLTCHRQDASAGVAIAAQHDMARGPERPRSVKRQLSG